LEDLPAAVGIAEAALQCARPAYGRVARDAADAEDLDIQPMLHRGGPVRARLERVAVKARAVTAAAHQPVGHRTQPAGEVGFHPEHMQGVWRHRTRAQAEASAPGRAPWLRPDRAAATANHSRSREPDRA